METVPSVRSTQTLPAILEGLPTVKSQKELNTALQNLKQNFNVLVPAQMNFSSPLHKVALEAVQLDPSVDGKKNGIDIYSPDGSERFTLHYKAANKIAGAAGINWTKSFVAKREVGEDHRVIYVEHVVEWEVKRPNGSTKKGATTGYYRYEEDKAKLQPSQVNSRRRFAEALAESNAKLRGIFEALEQLPRHFTLDEIRKPFLVPCVIEDLSDIIKDDPEAKRMVVAHSLGIVDQVYGGQQSRRPDPNLVTASAEVVEEKPAGESQVVNKSNGEIKFTEAEYRGSWKSNTRVERVSEIERLINTKAYQPRAGSKQPNELTDQQQGEYLWFLYNLPDVKVAEAPLPWGN